MCFLTRIANHMNMVACATFFKNMIPRSDTIFVPYEQSNQSNQVNQPIKSNQTRSICHLYIQKEKLETFLTKKKTPPWSTEPTETGGFNQVTSDPVVVLHGLNVWPAVFQRGECIVTMPGSNCNRPWRWFLLPSGKLT